MHITPMTEGSNDFKMIAVRILDGCATEYCNNLKPFEIYKFYQHYQFDEDCGSITKITKTGSDFGLYNHFVPEDRNLKINVSAIVGKNGSGKSTLVELLYLCAYLVAEGDGLLSPDLMTESGKKQVEELKNIKAGLKLEVYFEIRNKFRCIVINRDYVYRDRQDCNIEYLNLLGRDIVSLMDFFYTIVTNYSLHGLNDYLMGPWINKLFHKNDGYQTPIVINPFREKGSINVNREMHFAQTRLLSNIRLNENNAIEIVKGRNIMEIKFIIDRERLNRYGGEHNLATFDALFKSNRIGIDEIFDKIYFAILGEERLETKMSRSDWAEMTKNYVVIKLIRIAKNYTEYRHFYIEVFSDLTPSFKDLDNYLEKLKTDFTHVTLKLRQALNFFKHDPLRMSDKRIILENDRITIPVDLFSERINKLKTDHPGRNPMEFVPIAPFTPRIILNDGQDFHKLSSGEQQFIHTIQAILYHILNLNSVYKNDNENRKVTYDVINIILDEVELCFHPEYQRRFISELLEQISNLDALNIQAINLQFLTHSPFILSDIPASHTLHLEDGYVRKDKQATFAANIHKMLSSNFFMDSTSGEFAKIQYEEIIKFYERVMYAAKFEGLKSHLSINMETKGKNTDNFDSLNIEYHNIRNRFSFIVDHIGEPVIRGILKNHMDFLDQRFAVNHSPSEELSALKLRLETELEDVNRKLRRTI